MSEVDTSNVFTQLGLSQTSAADKKPNDQLGQAEFLKLMTTQLQFQDPLKPMENGNFLGQMAQFGTVSGVNDLNTTMNTMSASFQSNQALQASTLVGRSVLVPSASAYLTPGQPISAAVELQRPVSQVIVSVKNAAGELVYRKDLGLQSAGLVDFQWDGRDVNGNALPSGNYQIDAELNNGSASTSGKTYTVADVESVTLGVGGQDLRLSLSGLGDIDIGQVRKIL